MLIFSTDLLIPGAAGVLSAVVNSVTAMMVVMDCVAMVDRRKAKSKRLDEDRRNLTWIWDDKDSKNQC